MEATIWYDPGCGTLLMLVAPATPPAVFCPTCRPMVTPMNVVTNASEIPREHRARFWAFDPPSSGPSKPALSVVEGSSVVKRF